MTALFGINLSLIQRGLSGKDPLWRCNFMSKEEKSGRATWVSDPCALGQTKSWWYNEFLANSAYPSKREGVTVDYREFERRKQAVGMGYKQSVDPPSYSKILETVSCHLTP
jgi:hypothetical protein